MATYNNGLYTPWTPATTAAEATSPAAVWEPATSSAIDAVTTSLEGTTDLGATTSSTSMTAQAATTTTQWWTTSSSSSSRSSSSSSSSTPSSSSPTPASSSTSSSYSSSSSMPTSSSATLHSSSLSSSMSSHSSSAAASASAISDASSSSGAFKITYLLPVFIIVPCVGIFLLLAWSYGKFWAKPRGGGARESAHSTSYWYAGRGGTYNSANRNEEDDDLDDEKGGLVEGRWVGDEEKGAGGAAAGALDQKVSGRWRGWLPLRRGGTKNSHNSLAVPFVSVSYASLDQPFLPPSDSNPALSRSATKTSDRGWTWGTKPQATTSALRDANDESSRHLTANGWGGTARKYRAKSARSKNGSMGSRLSDKILRRLSGGGGGMADDTAPSPSVYSPAFEPGHRGGGPGGGIYAEIDGDDDDVMEELDDKKKVDLDAYLGESRVGEGDLARRYISGEVTERDFAALPPSRSASRHYVDDDPTKSDYYARQALASARPASRPSPSAMAFDAPPPSFAVNLPSAPPRTQVSPKKSKSSLLRPPPPETPSATPPPQLLFNYDSPPVPRPPLPVPGHQTSFTAQPPRIPFRNQAAPQLARPRRSNTATPFSPESAPGLFFASPAMHSPPSASRHANVGSAMPDFQPGALRASESAFSLAGVDGLIFGDGGGAGRSESRAGLKELVEAERKPKSRREEIEQLKRSAPAVVPAGSSSTAQGTQPRPHSSSPTKHAAAPAGSSRPLSEPPKPTLPNQGGPRESLGFDPVFSDSPPIPPLQHPSKVRAAIETLEARSAGHLKTPSQDSGRSSDSSAAAKSASATPPRLPSPPVPQKLERSTTTLGRNYRRRHGGGGGFDYSEDEADDDEDGGDDDDEALKDRRVSMLLLNRSRTQSGPATASSQDSHEASGSAEHDVRPLSSDPARLQQMLKRKSVGAELGGGGHESSGVKVDEEGTLGGRLLGLMTRRSGLFE
ncbi:hypothetical protein JCM1841_000789 [Sporobolomyces salmonicolor]